MSAGDCATAQHWLKVARRALREASTPQGKKRAREDIAYWTEALRRAR